MITNRLLLFVNVTEIFDIAEVPFIKYFISKYYLPYFPHALTHEDTRAFPKLVLSK